MKIETDIIASITASLIGNINMGLTSPFWWYFRELAILLSQLVP
jgi:hypothetical protein